MGLTVNGNYDNYSNNREIANLEQGIARGNKLKKALFEKADTKKAPDTTLSRKDIQRELKISKKEAKQLYK